MPDTEADTLRKNFAQYLVRDYINNPEAIAFICNDQLDPSGKLLDILRTEARTLSRTRSNMD